MPQIDVSIDATTGELRLHAPGVNYLPPPRQLDVTTPGWLVDVQLWAKSASLVSAFVMQAPPPRCVLSRCNAPLLAMVACDHPTRPAGAAG